MNGGVSTVNCLSGATTTRIDSSATYRFANNSPVTVLKGIAGTPSVGWGEVGCCAVVGCVVVLAISGFLKPFSISVELMNSSRLVSCWSSVCSSLMRFSSVAFSYAIFRILSSSCSLSSGIMCSSPFVYLMSG